MFSFIQLMASRSSANLTWINVTRLGAVQAFRFLTVQGSHHE